MSKNKKEEHKKKEHKKKEHKKETEHKKREHKKKEHRCKCGSGKCTPVQFFGSGETFNQPCNGQTIRLFKTTEDLAARNASITLENFGTCPVTFYIKKCEGKTKTVTVNPSTEYNIILPCIVEIKVKCGNNPEGLCDAAFNMTYYQCVCCSK